MSAYLSVGLRAQISDADRRRCCYCQTSEANSGLSMTHDHIRPRSLGGDNSFENVCLACHRCNEAKSDRLNATDPLSGEEVPLFHPRQQFWPEHFRWSADGTRIEGLTVVGRSTVEVLRMNHPVIVAARARWVISGWHPPD
jgi:hypothetical protein